MRNLGRQENSSPFPNANIEIARGTFVTIVGPSGCGKSSLLLSIAGLVRGLRVPKKEASLFSSLSPKYWRTGSAVEDWNEAGVPFALQAAVSSGQLG